jgi:hypothetical protein
VLWVDDIEWVQCEECEKWRILPPHVKSDSLPGRYVCSMSRWMPSPSCLIPGDVWVDDEAASAAPAAAVARAPATHTAAPVTDELSEPTWQPCANEDTSSSEEEGDSTPEAAAEGAVKASEVGASDGPAASAAVGEMTEEDQFALATRLSKNTARDQRIFKRRRAEGTAEDTVGDSTPEAAAEGASEVVGASEESSAATAGTATTNSGPANETPAAVTKCENRRKRQRGGGSSGGGPSDASAVRHNSKLWLSLAPAVSVTSAQQLTRLR